MHKGPPENYYLYGEFMKIVSILNLDNLLVCVPLFENDGFLRSCQIEKLRSTSFTVITVKSVTPPVRTSMCCIQNTLHWNLSHVGQFMCIIFLLYRHTSFYYISQILRFLQIEGLRQPCIEQVCQRHFSNSICSLRVSVSDFGISRNISNFFVIIISVMVICDQWSLMLLL
jgi:hypothetical protein